MGGRRREFQEIEAPAAEESPAPGARGGEEEEQCEGAGPVHCTALPRRSVGEGPLDADAPLGGSAMPAMEQPRLETCNKGLAGRGL